MPNGYAYQSNASLNHDPCLMSMGLKTRVDDSCSTSTNWTANNQSQVLPVQSQGTQGHTRVPLVHSISTTYQLEKRIDWYYSTSSDTQCTKHRKGQVCSQDTTTLIYTKKLILHWSSDLLNTCWNPTIKNPSRVPMTPQGLQWRTISKTT